MNQTASVSHDVVTQEKRASALPFTVVRKVGRPSRFAAELADGLCALVQFEGYSDTQAGLLVGVPRATLSRWKAEEEDFAFQLEQARALFQRAQVLRVLEAKRSDGTPDWRASAWLLQRMFPEQYGTAGQRGRVQEEGVGAGGCCSSTSTWAEGAVDCSVSSEIRDEASKAEGVVSRSASSEMQAGEGNLKDEQPTEAGSAGSLPGEGEGRASDAAPVESARKRSSSSEMMEAQVVLEEADEQAGEGASSVNRPQTPSPGEAQLRHQVRAQAQLEHERAGHAPRNPATNCH